MEEITGRISTLEGKVSEHDRIFDMIKIDITNERIDDTNKRIEGMDRRLKGKMDSNFKWMLGNSDCDVDNDNKCNSFTLNLFFQKESFKYIRNKGGDAEKWVGRIRYFSGL